LVDGTAGTVQEEACPIKDGFGIPIPLSFESYGRIFCMRVISKSPLRVRVSPNP
jgi:hypothetical protein